MSMSYIGPDSKEITFSEFKGENKKSSLIPCPLIVYSVRFWKENLYWIS